MFTFNLIQSILLVIGETRAQSCSYLIRAFVLLFGWAVGCGLPTEMTISGIVIVVLVTMVI